MSELPAEPDVVDDEARHRFFVVLDEGEGELVYRVSENRLILEHAGVDEAIRGRGIAGRLVSAAVARAARTGETVVPWCPYARRWLERHPDESSSISVDWSRPGH